MEVRRREPILGPSALPLLGKMIAIAAVMQLEQSCRWTTISEALAESVRTLDASCRWTAISEALFYHRRVPAAFLVAAGPRFLKRYSLRSLVNPFDWASLAAVTVTVVVPFAPGRSSAISPANARFART